jgi:hypothetical protein
LTWVHWKKTRKVIFEIAFDVTRGFRYSTVRVKWFGIESKEAGRGRERISRLKCSLCMQTQYIHKIYRVWCWRKIARNSPETYFNRKRKKIPHIHVYTYIELLYWIWRYLYWLWCERNRLKELTSYIYIIHVYIHAGIWNYVRMDILYGNTYMTIYSAVCSYFFVVRHNVIPFYMPV